jgi:sugar phosphate isomerase/epimerase
MAESTYLSTIERLLTKFGDRINVVHLCDSTLRRDGLAFGTGDMEMERLSQRVARLFEGYLVLEVMPDEQTDARKELERYLTHPSSD